MRVQITIRDIIWLTTIVATITAWTVDHCHQSSRLQLKAQQLNDASGEVLTWQGRTEVLADLLRHEGYNVTWDGTRLTAGKRGDSANSATRDVELHENSSPQDTEEENPFAPPR